MYDLFAYRRTQDQPNPQPAVVYTLARETHAADLPPGQPTKIQHSFSYSDGFGREIQKKIQAEPGPAPQRDASGKIVVGADNQPVMTPNEVSPRWVGSGWTVFNNKGKPVRQYEPFFTDTHRFEFEVKIGVSPVLCYDPVERVVATLHPNHTWEKVVFDPWRQESWDVSDTVWVADPKTDPDVGEFFCRLPDADYLPTWHAQRQGGALGSQEQAAARKAAIHAATPTVAHADSLGRTVLTVAHNRFKYSDTPAAAPPVEEFHPTQVILDIEGNQREVIDAKDRVVMRYDYDLLGNRIHQVSMEAGERWMLNDVAGKPLYAWDSRDHRFRTAYDPLRRPTDSFLREGAGAELRVGRSVYGETQPNPEANNRRGKVVQVFDQAGVVTSDEYDFKGNLLRSQRQLAQDYKTALDWSATVPLEADLYPSRTRYDALNRPTELTAPDRSVIRPGYNEANLLERLDANLRGAQQSGQPVWTPFVTDIDYDAKGQRTLIDYGNGVRTTYGYDPLTFRLVHLLTRRNAAVFPGDCPQPPPAGWPGCQVQNLHYTYDPAGNITHIRDEAQQAVYFKNQRVEPSAEYTYDAIYRLIEATGREHLGQLGGTPIPHSYNDAPRVGLLHPGDGNAMGTYLERYVYDVVGNFLEMQHRGGGSASPAWTRAYSYNEPSLLEPGKSSNRLTRTTLGGTTETYSAGGNGYDAHGNMLRMPHLQVMQWDFKDQLHMTQRQAVNAADDEGIQHRGERTWYVYDSAGERVRKVTGLTAGHVKDERIYLGGFEIYRNNGANPLVRETLHIMDDKQRIALVEMRTQGNESGVPPRLIRYQFGNHLGSASLELDDQAQIVSYEEHSPYGSTSYQAVRSQTETSKRYRYTGKERDEESGFNYHGARYYAPWIGRWTSCDPAGLADGSNLYAYGSGRPTKVVDPTGTNGTVSEGSVLNSIDFTLKDKGIGYNTEITVKIKIELPDKSIKFVARRYDRAFYLNGELVLLEAKGSNLSGKLTKDQAIADSWVQQYGGEAEVISASGKPPAQHGASQTGNVFNIGQKIKVKPNNIHVVHGKAGGGSNLASKTTHIDSWKKTMSAIPDVKDPNMVRFSQPGKPPTYVPRSKVIPGKAYIPEEPKPTVDPQDAPKKGFSGKAGLKTGAKMVAPMIFQWVANYSRDRNYSEAAELRDTYKGPPSEDQIERQRRAGFEYSGELDENNSPKWDYKPSLPLRLREAVFFGLDPFPYKGSWEYGMKGCLTPSCI